MTEMITRETATTGTTGTVTVEGIEELYGRYGVTPARGISLAVGGTATYACVRGILFADMIGDVEEADGLGVNPDEREKIAEHHGLSMHYLLGLEEGFEDWEYNTLGGYSLTHEEKEDREEGVRDGIELRRALLT